LVLLNRIVEETQGDTVSGEKAFELYDTYGFPIDLTALILSEKNLKLDEKGFKAHLQKQKDRSRSASETSTEDWVVLFEDDVQEFIGYDTQEANVKIARYRKVTSKKEGEMYQLVFNLTPFYPEGGGQVGDKGFLEDKQGDVVYILDTKKENNVVYHLTKELPNHLTDSFKAVVGSEHRALSSSNHTATHLLHQALRTILGEHVEQKGSLVKPQSLRFDFSHFSKVTPQQLQEIEDFVNARIEGKLPLEEGRNVPMEKAVEEGAMALFGEKYGDTVRTIRFGQSIELCGGIHVKNTADIWHFKIISEGAVASGIRRIEAITNQAAKDYYTQNNEAYLEMKGLLNNAKEPVKALEQLQEENNNLKKQIENLLKDKAKNIKGELKNELTEINGIQFLAKKLDLDASGIKDVCFELGSQFENLFLLFGAEKDGKAILSCYISKELVANKGLNAGNIVRALGKHIQGGGGGQPFFATAGGKNPAGIETALEAAKDYL